MRIHLIAWGQIVPEPSLALGRVRHRVAKNFYDPASANGFLELGEPSDETLKVPVTFAMDSATEALGHLEWLEIHQKQHQQFGFVTSTCND